MTQPADPTPPQACSTTLPDCFKPEAWMTKLSDGEVTFLHEEDLSLVPAQHVKVIRTHSTAMFPSSVLLEAVKVIEMLIACHEEPSCPAVVVARDFLTRGTMEEGDLEESPALVSTAVEDPLVPDAEGFDPDQLLPMEPEQPGQEELKTQIAETCPKCSCPHWHLNGTSTADHSGAWQDTDGAWYQGPSLRELTRSCGKCGWSQSLTYRRGKLTRVDEIGAAFPGRFNV